MEGGLILGTARCGSTLVSRILRAHPEILSLSELFATAGPRAFRPDRLDGRAFWTGLARPDRGLSRVANPRAAPSEFLYGKVENPRFDPYHCPPILAVTLPHLLPQPDALFQALGPVMAARGRGALADHYRALFAELAAQMGGRRVWVERSGGSLAAAATLARMFPEARQAVLLRDGAETALSMRDYPAARLAIWVWRHLRHLGADPVHPRRHYGRGALWPVIAALGGRLPIAPILERPPSLSDAGAFWSALTVSGLAALSDSRPLVLRYEALCRDPAPAITRLGMHLAGTAPDAWVAEAATFPRPPRPRLAGLSETERKALLDACAPGEAAVARFIATAESEARLC